MEPHLPHEILYRPKMGFAVPLARWFRGPLRQRVRESVLGTTLADTGFFDQRMLKEMVEAHQSGRRDYSAPLWTVLMFEAFLRNVLNAGSNSLLRATG
jgi:asparagine synthase (glutamine-hydrolysing)